MINPSPEKKRKSLAELYPQLTPEQLQEAEERLKRYLEIALKIYEDITRDPVRYAELQKTLTILRGSRNMKNNRQSANTNSN